MGWLNDPKEHVVPLVLGGILVFFALMIFVFVLAVIYVLTKDFVVPQMALEDVGAIRGMAAAVVDDQGREGQVTPATSE